MKNILVVHQSADLYGSDRVMLALVSALDRQKYHPIVLLPIDGPLVAELETIGIEYHVVSMLRLSRATLSLRGLLRLPVDLYRGMRDINKAIKGRRIDLVHSNTLAVLSGAAWASLHRIPHLWHVHEIILHPQFVRKVYAFLLSWFADSIVCVSNATKENLLLDNPKLESKIHVVWNGLARGNSADSEVSLQYRKQLQIQSNELLVVLVGRINRVKGQILLVEAAGILWRLGIRNLHFLFVGSVVPGQEHFQKALQEAIGLSPAQDRFIVQEFVHNVWPIWNACDIAVIPSTEPESFGMVALEAMALSKPIVAANHGGVAEIVAQGETGLLVQVGDAIALADAIRRVAGDASLRQKMGLAGELRCRSVFTLDRHAFNIVGVYERTMKGG